MLSKSKQLLMVVLLSILLLGGVVQTVAADEPEANEGQVEATHFRYEPTGTVNTQYLNVRSGPGTGFDKVASVYYGHILYLLNRTNDSTWLRVRLGEGQIGWVYAAYVNAPWDVIAHLPVMANVPPVPPPHVPPEANGYVTVSQLNVRSGPGFHQPVIGTLWRGEHVTLLGRDSRSQWLQVRLSNYAKGWVAAQYVNSSVPIWQLPITEVGMPDPPATYTGYVTPPTLNVRSGPGFNYWVIDRLGQGQSVTIYGRDVSGRWYKVGLPNGASGWVAARYVRIDVPVYEMKTLES